MTFFEASLLFSIHTLCAGHRVRQSHEGAFWHCDHPKRGPRAKRARYLTNVTLALRGRSRRNEVGDYVAPTCLRARTSSVVEADGSRESSVAASAEVEKTSA